MVMSAASFSDRNGLALGVMLFTVLWGSLISVGVFHFSPDSVPLQFVAFWRLGSCMVSFAVFAVMIRTFFREDLVLFWAYRSRFLCLPVVFTAFGGLEYGFLVMSARYISPSLAVIIVESHMLVGSLVLLRVARGRYADHPFMLAVLLPLAFLGLVLVVSAEYGGLRALLAGLAPEGAGLGPILGAFLVLLPMVMIGLGYLLFPWSERLGGDVSRAGSGCSPVSLGVAAVSLGTGLGHLASFPLGLVSGLVLLGEPVVSWQVALTAFLLGLALNGAFSAGWRISYVLSRYVGIGVLIYLMPGLSLVWLRLLGIFGDVSLPHLAVGMVILLGSGVLLQCQPHGDGDGVHLA